MQDTAKERTVTFLDVFNCLKQWGTLKPSIYLLLFTYASLHTDTAEQLKFWDTFQQRAILHRREEMKFGQSTFAYGGGGLRFKPQSPMTVEQFIVLFYFICLYHKNALYFKLVF